MIRIRRAADRGQSRNDWLDSRFSFSFADYHDAAHMGFRALRVINEDRIAPGTGFGAHPHRDMEILTYPISGQLEHRDSQGSAERLTAGRIQLMTAGSGIVHSETNPSSDEPLHLLQIWILPDRTGLAPGYQEREIARSDASLQALVTPDGRDETIRIHQDATVYRVSLDRDEKVDYAIPNGRHVWVQVVRGSATLNGEPVAAGDGASVSDESSLRFEAADETEALLFDLA